MKIAAQVKSAYGPTLPDLARARFGAQRRGIRAASALIAASVAIVVLVLVLRGGPDTIHASAGGIRVSFRYAGLRRERAPAGDALLLARHEGSRLVAEISLAPLRLPADAGQPTGVEPLVAANYMRSLAARIPAVVVQNTGPTIVNGIAGYNFTYTRMIAGEELLRSRDLPDAGGTQGRSDRFAARPTGAFRNHRADCEQPRWCPVRAGAGRRRRSLPAVRAVERAARDAPSRALISCRSRPLRRWRQRSRSPPTPRSGPSSRSSLLSRSSPCHRSRRSRPLRRSHRAGGADRRRATRA